MLRLILLLSLAACSNASPDFRDVPATRVDVGGSKFDVRVRGGLAEAVRLNPQYAPRFGRLRSRAAFAMAQVSGCEVVGVLGDQAVATGVLSCDGRSPDRALSVAALRFDCIENSQWVNEGPGLDYAEFECDPY